VGLSVSVRKAKSRTSERNRDKSVGVSVYIGQRAAMRALRTSLARRRTDRARRLRHRALHCRRPGRRIARTSKTSHGAAATRDLDLFHPGTSMPRAPSKSPSAASARPLTVDKRITNSKARACPRAVALLRGNTHGFRGGYASSRHSLSVAPIASLPGKSGDDMQRDAWYMLQRSPEDLAAPEAVGRYAAERALSRLNSRKIATCEVPVLYESTVAAGLLGAYVQATSGGALYASRASCSTRWASRCCPTTSTFMKTRTSCAARAARPSTTKAW